jgi:hypothetical protein
MRRYGRSRKEHKRKVKVALFVGQKKTWRPNLNVVVSLPPTVLLWLGSTYASGVMLRGME